MAQPVAMTKKKN